MELNAVSLSDFTKLAQVIWTKGLESVPAVAQKSGIFKEVTIAGNSGDKREFSEIDLAEYAKTKGESDQADRAKVQQGLTLLALVKSFLINGENLKAQAFA